VYILWSQYKLARKKPSEFLRKQIIGIPNFANRNSNFLTFQTSEFQKSNQNFRNRKQNQNSTSNGGLRNQNQKSEFPTKAFGKLISHFILGGDKVNLIADANGELNIVGEKGKKKHKKRSRITEVPSQCNAQVLLPGTMALLCFY
jgi:hypothetical protein